MRYLAVVTLLLALAGCGSAISKSLGVGKRPYIPYAAFAPIELTAEEKARIAKAYEEDALLKSAWEKLRKHNNKKADVLTEYMKDAIEINRNQITQVLGYSKEAANAAIKADLKILGYPDDDKLLQDLKEPK